MMEVSKKSGERYLPCALKHYMYLKEKNGSEDFNPLEANDKRY